MDCCPLRLLDLLERNAMFKICRTICIFALLAFEFSTLATAETIRLDDDGTGPTHNDPNHRSQTSGTLKGGKIVPRLPSDPSLNADTDAYAVAPTGGTFKVGDYVTLQLESGRQITLQVGDYGPKNTTLGEISIKAAKDLGIEILETAKGPIPTLDGQKASDINVAVIPEPASIVLWGLAYGLSLLYRREVLYGQLEILKAV